MCFKQKSAYEFRISDWSSDVCSSDLHMLIKEFIQVFRDPKMRGIVFVMPVVQVLVFGYAVTLDVKNIATAVYDLDNTVASRELVARFEKSGYFEIVEYVASAERARALLDQIGRASCRERVCQYG